MIMLEEFIGLSNIQADCFAIESHQIEPLDEDIPVLHDLWVVTNKGSDDGPSN